MTQGASFEFLASFCFVGEGELEREIEALRAFASRCSAALRHWEILYIIDERDEALLDPKAASLATIKNLRILSVNRDTNFYRRRKAAASEAIGDVVAISAFDEIAEIDPIPFAIEAMEKNEILIASRAGSGSSLSHGVLAMVSDYKINSRDLKTVVFPREHLSRLMLRSTVNVDLRFEAKRGGERFSRKSVSGPRSPSKVHWRRFELLAEILSSAAPRFLKAYAVFSLIVAALAVLYSLYACIVVLTQDYVQPGWFTTALVQAGSVCFIALGFSIFSVGLARISEGSANGRAIILNEIGSTALFESADDLNVEYTSAGRRV